MWVGVDGGIFIVDRRHRARCCPARHRPSRLRHPRRSERRRLGRQQPRPAALPRRPARRHPDGRERPAERVHDARSSRIRRAGSGSAASAACRCMTDGKLTNYTTKEGLVGNYVRSIYEDSEGTLWIGTYGEGLSRFKGGKFVNYRVENGLFDNGVFAIQEDEAGSFWISSNRGIYRVKKRALNDFADGKIAKFTSVGYGVGDGMLSSECNGGRQPASLTDKDGRFWFPTQDGVVVIEPGNERANDPAAVGGHRVGDDRARTGRHRRRPDRPARPRERRDQLRRHQPDQVGSDPLPLPARGTRRRLGRRRHAPHRLLLLPAAGPLPVRRHRRQQRRRLEPDGRQPGRRLPALLLPDVVVLPGVRRRRRRRCCSAPGRCG